MRFEKIFTAFLIPFIFLIQQVSAHCPLCTIGAAAAAAGAVWLGVSTLVVSLFIGAFAIATGLWFSRIIKSKIPFKKTIITIASFLLTVIPILPILSSTPHPIYVSLFGNYGTLFNRTYLINPILITSLYGGAIVILGPTLSNKLTKLRRGKRMPFQGMTIIFSLLIISALLIQFIS